MQDESNKALLSEKKFSKECMRTCVSETRYSMPAVEARYSMLAVETGTAC